MAAPDPYRHADPWLDSLRDVRRKEAELRVVEEEWFVLHRLKERAERQRDALTREVAALKERSDVLYAADPDAAEVQDDRT